MFTLSKFSPIHTWMYLTHTKSVTFFLTLNSSDVRQILRIHVSQVGTNEVKWHFFRKYFSGEKKKNIVEDIQKNVHKGH